MRQLLIRPNAQADINEAARWYEREHPGLGYRFMEALDTLYDRIQGYPLLFPILENNVRRALSPRFPYGVYFVVGEELISVLAVLHLHRHPDTWKGRI